VSVLVQARSYSPLNQWTALLACFWIAAKLEVPRKQLPGVSTVAALLNMQACELNALEANVMARLDWAPLRGWDDGNHIKGCYAPAEPEFFESPNHAISILLYGECLARELACLGYY
jgi:hypothetical protein